MSVDTEQAMISVKFPLPKSYWLFQGKSRYAIKWEYSGEVERVNIFLERCDQEDDEHPAEKWVVVQDLAAVSQNYSVVLKKIQLKQPIRADNLYRIRIVDAKDETIYAVSGFFSIVRDV